MNATSHQPVTALLVAGRRPGVDPLAAAFGVSDKALISVGGEPMLSRVARILASHPSVSRVVVLAQDPAALMADVGTAWMANDVRIEALAGGNSVSAAVGAALSAYPGGWPFLLTTADNVLLDNATIDEFLAGAKGDGDVAVGLVERRIFAAKYPNAKRTWLHFRKGAYSGANLFYLARPAAAVVVAFWQRIESERKRARALAAAFGLPLLAAYVLRLLDVRQGIGAAGRKLGVVARPVELKTPEACIDVDKPADHTIAEAILADRMR